MTWWTFRRGRDAWVIGDEPFETLAFMGGASWLAPFQTLKERVLVTLMFTDIVDSTEAARRLGDRAWADLLNSHYQRTTETVTRHHGPIAKLTGDGVLAVFDGAAPSGVPLPASRTHVSWGCRFVPRFIAERWSGR